MAVIIYTCGRNFRESSARIMKWEKQDSCVMTVCRLFSVLERNVGITSALGNENMCM